MKQPFAPPVRLWIVCAVVVAAFFGIGARLVHLQVFEAERLASQVERARKSSKPIKARRGEIRDGSGIVLATSRTVFEVGVDPQATRREDEARLAELAQVLVIPEAEVLAAFRRTIEAAGDGGATRLVRWTRLADAVDERTYERVLALGIKGVYGNRQFRRSYPGGGLAAHLIGFVNHEGTAAMGIEQHLDFYLRGQDGWRETEHDGHRRELAQFRSREVPATDGYHIVLAIDSFVQHCIETELRQIARRFDPVGATIIVSDPATGFILGMANYPSFDPNTFNRADLASLRNRAVTDLFEPGSTFKIVAAAGALNEHLVTPEARFNCASPTIERFGRTYQLPRDSHEYGELTMTQIVTKSSNRGAAHLGLLLGPTRLHDYAAAFGFGERSGFSPGPERDGTLHPVEKWDGLTITRLPMGHAVGATALQVHNAMAAIANNGVLLRPQIVRRIVDRDNTIVFDFPAVPRRRVVRPETAQLMAKLLTGVVSPEGTAPKAVIPGFEVAGKTGTTQKIIDGRYSNRHHVGSFVGFFPASRPRLVISVIIDDARLNGTAYGSTVAAPSFKVIAEQLIQYLGISPTETPPAAATVARAFGPNPRLRDRLR